MQCVLCSKVALYQVDKKGYCRDHYAVAKAQLHRQSVTLDRYRGEAERIISSCTKREQSFRNLHKCKVR